MKFEFAPWNEFRQAAAQSQEPENARFLAETYWRALLILALIVAVLSVFYGFSELSNVSSVVESASTTQAPPSPLLDRAALETAVSGFSARQTTYEQVKTQPPTIPDPSI